MRKHLAQSKACLALAKSTGMKQITLDEIGDPTRKESTFKSNYKLILILYNYRYRKFEVSLLLLLEVDEWTIPILRIYKSNSLYLLVYLLEFSKA